MVILVVVVVVVVEVRMPVVLLSVDAWLVAYLDFVFLAVLLLTGVDETVAEQMVRDVVATTVVPTPTASGTIEPEIVRLFVVEVETVEVEAVEGMAVARPAVGTAAEELTMVGSITGSVSVLCTSTTGLFLFFLG